MSHVQRRNFLRGLGGFALALPFLPSLVREAKAAPSAPRPKHFVAMCTEHGGVWSNNMFPGATPAETRQYKGHAIRRAPLSLSVASGMAAISPVLTGDAGKLTPALAKKMNVLQGLDHPFYIAHHSGGHLGNYARNDGNGGDGKAMQAFPNPTVDQLMAYSPAFYPDIQNIKERSLVAGRDISYFWANPETRSGSITAVKEEYSSKALFSRIFVPPKDPVAMRTPVVDRVMESYKRLRNGSRRLSAADRVRLDEHMARVDELDRKLGVTVSCGAVKPPTKDSMDERKAGFDHDPEAQGRFFQLINDVIVAAFVCGTSRVVTLRVTDTFSTSTDDWHQQVAHGSESNASREDTLWRAHQKTFQEVFLDLVAKLDAVEVAPGATLLDDTLVMWSQESGAQTHEGQGIPVVTAGSAGGALVTGQHLDYRNLASKTGKGNGQAIGGEGTKIYSGLLYNQWLGNVLDLMGVPRAEWQKQSDQGGYGKLLVGPDYKADYDAAVSTGMDEMLPWLVA